MIKLNWPDSVLTGIQSVIVFWAYWFASGLQSERATGLAAARAAWTPSAVAVKVIQTVIAFGIGMYVGWRSVPSLTFESQLSVTKATAFSVALGGTQK